MPHTLRLPKIEELPALDDATKQQHKLVFVF